MIVAQLLIALIALVHVGIFFMESVFWQRPSTMRIFKMTPESAAITRIHALNQGVYNLFLATGLAWSLVASDPLGFDIKIFFLTCVVVAGIVGGISASKRIFLIQAVPAVVTIALVLIYH